MKHILPTARDATTNERRTDNRERNPLNSDALDDTKLNTADVYRRRFDREAAYRTALWKLLCEEYFQRFIDPSHTVMEVAAGHCEFINNIRAERKIAVDINEDTRTHAARGVEVVLTPSTDLGVVPAATVDRVFVSNFFEHIPKPEITQTLKECHRALKPGGKLLVLQPNIRYCARDYWMFYDHITPIDDRALCEALELTGFEIELLRPQFLPYTTKSRLPRSLALVRLYLKTPLLHRIFGGQAFVVAVK